MMLSPEGIIADSAQENPVDIANGTEQFQTSHSGVKSMSNALNEFLATATQKAADDLLAAYMRLPEDKRGWSPDAKARPAVDLVAECALINGYTADFIQTRQWSNINMAQFESDKTALAALDSEALGARLQENTARVIEAIRAVPEGDFNTQLTMPWGSRPLDDIMAYCYWNMTYHLGQINYIASILGCLE